MLNKKGTPWGLPSLRCLEPQILPLFNQKIYFTLFTLRTKNKGHEERPKKKKSRQISRGISTNRYGGGYEDNI